MFSRALLKLSAPGASRLLHVSRTCLAPLTLKVPNMGDSITEGTIIKQLCPIGTVIKEGDVVALIETDKVTVDIKALYSGIITHWCSGVDSTVLVGGDLYTIDTDTSKGGAPPPAAASAPAASAPAVSAPAASAPAPPPASSASAPSSHGRHHSIHFLGKSGWANRKAGHDSHAPAAPAAKPAAAKTGTAPVSMGLAKDFDPMKGRPAFSQEEIDAIESGGATVWDKPKPKPTAKPGDKKK